MVGKRRIYIRSYTYIKATPVDVGSGKFLDLIDGIRVTFTVIET
jgi:hypothetical protein